MFAELRSSRRNLVASFKNSSRSNTPPPPPQTTNDNATEPEPAVQTPAQIHATLLLELRQVYTAIAQAVGSLKNVADRIIIQKNRRKREHNVRDSTSSNSNNDGRLAVVIEMSAVDEEYLIEKIRRLGELVVYGEREMKRKMEALQKKVEEKANAKAVKAGLNTTTANSSSTVTNSSSIQLRY